MNEKSKKAITAPLRNNKGFTLIEMAIVLVIIGLIIGAVVKGQDLITNAKAKKLTSTVNTWSALTFAFMDRMGRFPGDGGRNGNIGDQAGGATLEQTVLANATDALPGCAISELTNAAAGMTNTPQNPVIVGGASFYVYPGSASISNGITTTTKNAFVICATSNCAAGTFLNSEAMQILQAVDTAIDGNADGGVGQFRAITAANLFPNAPALSAAAGNRFVGTLTGVTPVDTTAAGVATAWNTTTHIGAVWLFDKPF